MRKPAVKRRRQRAGVAPASEPFFEPQWVDYGEDDLDEWLDNSKEELDELRSFIREDAGDACRLCNCTEFSPCPNGCAWIEGDLCSSCEDLMAEWPMLRIADGHGIAASWAAQRTEERRNAKAP